MSRKEKLLQKIRNNPKNVSFEDLDRILDWYEFDRRQSRSGSSHYVYTRGSYSVTVPFRRPHVGTVYVKEVLAILAEIDDESETE